MMRDAGFSEDEVVVTLVEGFFDEEGEHVDGQRFHLDEVVAENYVYLGEIEVRMNQVVVVQLPTLQPTIVLSILIHIIFVRHANLTLQAIQTLDYDATKQPLEIDRHDQILVLKDIHPPQILLLHDLIIVTFYLSF